MLIELDILSGQPNPVWALDESDSQVLQRLQEGLSTFNKEPPSPPGLGYRGFCYGEGRCRFRAYGGFIQSAEVLLIDRTQTIERFLRDKLPTRFAHLRARMNLQ
jgi:hypothetical protein